MFGCNIAKNRFVIIFASAFFFPLPLVLIMKQQIRNKVKDILTEQHADNYKLYYSSLLDQLYVLYIIIIGIGFLLLAHLSIWPVIILLAYTIIAYLFGAYRNHSFAINESTLWIINGRKPFVKSRKIELVEIDKIIIGSNANAILDRIFIIPSNIYISIFTKNEILCSTWYTNIDFAQDAKQGEKSMEDFMAEIQKLGISIECTAHRDEDEL
jgi:hypothetical protein